MSKALLKRSQVVVGMAKTLRGFSGDIRVVGWLAKRRAQIAGYLRSHAVKKLQLGTSNNALNGWLNTDVFAESSVDRLFGRHQALSACRWNVRLRDGGAHDRTHRLRVGREHAAGVLPRAETWWPCTICHPGSKSSSRAVLQRKDGHSGELH